MDSDGDTPYRGGLPHSEIPGSPIARISPGLSAACPVLHRLSVPRHPPDALPPRSSATPNGKDKRGSRPPADPPSTSGRHLLRRHFRTHPSRRRASPRSPKGLAFKEPRTSRAPERTCPPRSRHNSLLHHFRQHHTAGPRPAAKPATAESVPVIGSDL